MSNKLTDERLKELILEVMSESKAISIYIGFNASTSALKEKVAEELKKLKLGEISTNEKDAVFVDFKTKITQADFNKIVDTVQKVDSSVKEEDFMYFINKDGDDDIATTKDKLVTDPSKSDSEASPTDWKKDALGDVDPDYISDTTKKYTDPGRQKILVALRSAFSGVLTPAQLKHLASLSEVRLREDANSLEIDDIMALYGKSPDDKFKSRGKDTNLDVAKEIDKALKTYINNLKDRSKAADIFKAKKKFDAMLATSRGLKPSISPERSGTSAMPTTSQIGGDTKAPVDPVVFQSFEEFFRGKNDLKDRVQHLSEFSKAVIDKNLNSYSPEVIFTGGNVLSILSRMTRQQDASAAGFIAEAFLAFLVAGSKTGQSGGAGDFEGPDGRLYSSKWGQKSKSQAKSNFNTKGEIITYVSAFKTTFGNVGTSKTMAISKIELSVYDVYTHKPNKDLRKGNVGAFGTKYPVNVLRSIKGKIQAKDGAKSTDFDVSPPSGATKFEIQFVTAEDETFDEVFSEAMKTVTNDLAKAATEFNSKSKELNELTTTYTVSGDFSEGVAMAKVYNNIQGILDRIATGKGSSSSEIGLTENKTKSLKDLDKLIERVILESMNKK